MEVELGDLYLCKGGSLDPAKYPEETFEYYSIPAYDKGVPEVILGSKIGSSKKIFQPNDILLSRIVPHIRRCWVVGADSGYRKIGSGEWITFRSQNIEASYLRHYLMSNEFNVRFLKTIKGVGGSLMRADPKQVSRFKIPLPPLDQQKKIATLLDTADAYRQKTKALIEKYDELTQSLFLDMFGDPVTNPMGWDEKKIGDICQMKAGKFVKASNILKEECSDFNPCFGGNGLRGYVESYTHEGEFVLIGRQGALCGNVKIANGKFHATEHAIVCSPLIEYEPLWLYHMLKLMNLNKYATGAAQPGLNVSTLIEIKVMFCLQKQQKQFVERVQAIEAQKTQVKASLAQAEDLFHSLLQRVFKGELTKANTYE